MLASPVIEHLPALQVVLPLMAAPACVLVARARVAWAIAQAVSTLALLIAATLLARVLAGGTLSYALGGWAAPWGIEYRVDALNALVLVLVSGLSTVILPFAAASAAREIRPSRLYLFYAAWMLALAGLLGMTVTGDAFNVFVFLEITSLSTYVLVAIGRDRRALLAAFRYLVMGTIGGTFFLIGLGVAYGLTGTLNMADLAARLPAVAGTGAARVALGFLVVGLALKMALFPLHAWLPNAYAYAPSAVSAMVAATGTKVAAYVLIRFLFGVFGADLAGTRMGIGEVLVPLGLAAALLASAVAIFQPNAKRLLAFSSIAQMGYIALGIGLFSVTGLTAAIVHLFNHALIKGALFLALGCVYYRVGSVRVADMAGLGRRMPWTMAGFTLAALSLAGMPLTAGFVSKWYLVAALLERGGWWMAALVLATSFMACIYLGRVIEAAYFRAPASERAARAVEAPAAMVVALWVLVAANFWFGLETSLTAGIGRAVASGFLGGAP